MSQYTNVRSSTDSPAMKSSIKESLFSKKKKNQKTAFSLLIICESKGFSRKNNSSKAYYLQVQRIKITPFTYQHLTCMHLQTIFLFSHRYTCVWIYQNSKLQTLFNINQSYLHIKTTAKSLGNLQTHTFAVYQKIIKTPKWK